ncbi:hypothetical protein A2U01_0115098, partial [Trifolium medium]|nr:hypothetical protein [Trifolium medium]
MDLGVGDDAKSSMAISNVDGALVTPIGITKNLKWPSK